MSSRRLPDFDDLGDPTDERFGDPELSQMPTLADREEVDRAIRQRIDALGPDEIGAIEDHKGERDILVELHGQAGAASILEDRARQRLYDAAERSIAGASRADFARVRADAAEAQQLWREFGELYPREASAGYAEAEAAANRVAQACRERGESPQKFLKEDRESFMLEVAYEIGARAGSDETGGGDRTAIAGGSGGGVTAQRGGEDERGADMVEELQRWQHGSGLY